MSDLQLTEGQLEAYRSFNNFLFDPNQSSFVIKGYAGTGKSTLVRTLVKELPSLISTHNLLNMTDIDWDIALTATTNKACESLQTSTGLPADTIHSFLGLRVQKDHKTDVTKLVTTSRTKMILDTVLIIDEASYIDENLLSLIHACTKDCKLVFIGDPAQLTPVKKSYAPVFQQGYPEAELTQVVRQADQNQIQEIATGFRTWVNGGVFPRFQPNQSEVVHVDHDSFKDLLIQDFGRSDWQYKDSKVLAWTNKAVIDYNHYIREKVQGEPNLQDGDYAVCNKHMSFKRGKLKTDQLVHVTNIRDAEDLGVPGYSMVIDDYFSCFMPKSLQYRKAALAEAKAAENYKRVEYIEDSWIDLRAAYSCTINKSQGSTFDRVFIDLDDIKRCNSGNQIARMLYVAVTRAREQVFLVGDVV